MERITLPHLKVVLVKVICIVGDLADSITNLCVLWIVIPRSQVLVLILLLVLNLVENGLVNGLFLLSLTLLLSLLLEFLLQIKHLVIIILF